MNHTEEQVDEYIRGEMIPSEKTTFEAEMERDPAFAREVSLTRMIVDGLRDRQEKLNAIEVWKQESGDKLASQVVDMSALEIDPRKERLRPWIPWLTAFSAAAVVVLGVFFFHPFSSPTIPSDISIQKTAMPGCDFSEIDSLIEQGRYQEALEAIKKAIIETDRLLQESLLKREEADDEVQRYEFSLRLLKDKQDALQTKRGAK